MAEPDKQQMGDGHDNYGHAVQQAAKAAKQATQTAAKKGAEAAVKGAEAATKAAAASVQAGMEAGGSAVSNIAVGTASGGPWGAIIAAAWSMRKTLFKVLICVCLVLVFLIVIIVSLPSIIWDYLFGTDDSPPVQNVSITDVYNEMADAVSVVINEGLEASMAEVENIIEENDYDHELCMEKLVNYAQSSAGYDTCYILAAYSASMGQRNTSKDDMVSKLSGTAERMFPVTYEEFEQEVTVPATYTTYSSVIAVGVMLYPLISTYVNEKNQAIIRSEYLGDVAAADSTELQATWNAAAEYNTQHKPIRYSNAAVSEAGSDYEELLNFKGNGVMGYVEVPKISVYLPIYHGTDGATLERGVGHLLGSSLPVGGESTHCVLTGHTGMSNQRLFTDLEQLAEGDVFYLHILDQVLAYQVDAIHTVEPYDTALLCGVEGRDLCTLITCTPYGVNSHRLLVRGTRIPYEAAEEIEAQEEPVAETESVWMQQYLKGLILGLGGLILFAAVILTFLLIRKRRRRHGS